MSLGLLGSISLSSAWSRSILDHHSPGWERNGNWKKCGCVWFFCWDSEGHWNQNMS